MSRSFITLLPKFKRLLLASAIVSVSQPAFAQTDQLRERLRSSCELGSETLARFVVDGSELSPSAFNFSYSQNANGTLEIRFASKATGGSMIFIGGEHITGAQPELFEYFRDLIATEGPAEVYIEVSDASYILSLPTSEKEVIQTRGEPSYLGFLAREKAIPVLPLEPSASQLREELRTDYPPSQMALAFVLREIQILRDRRGLFGEALERVASVALAEQALLSTGAELPTTNILTLTLEVERLWPGLDWRRVPAEWFNPLLSSEKTGSIYINGFFAQEMTVRDEHARELILSRIAAGKTIVALAGRTHAENHLVALNCMLQAM